MFGLAALAVAFSGYRRGGGSPLEAGSGARPLPDSAQVVSASIVDMGAIRHLSSTVVHLDGSVVALTKAVDETTHFSRNELDIMREMCQRLRELKDELERQGRDARGWDRRNEGRRTDP